MRQSLSSSRSQGLQIQHGGNNIQRAVNGNDSNGEGGFDLIFGLEGEAVPSGITTRGPLGAKRKEIM